MAAVACGVPAVFIGSDPAERNAIESAGIPFLEIHLNTDPAELDHRVEEVVRRYPWETIRAKSQRLREGLVEHLKSLGLRVRVAQSTREPARSAAKKHRIEGSLPKLAVATIVSPSALPSFIGLFENLQQTTDRPLHHHVLALDRSTELHLQKTFEKKPVSVYCPSDLWPETDITALLGPYAQRSAVLKPRFLRHVLQDVASPIVYCDALLHFYHPVAALLRFLKESHSIFFPVSSLFSGQEFLVCETSLLALAPGSEGLLEKWVENPSAGELAHEREGALPTWGFIPCAFPGAQIYQAKDPSGKREPAIGDHPRKNGTGLLGDRMARHRPAIGARELFDDKVVWDSLAYFFAPLSTALPPGEVEARALAHQIAYWKQLRLLFLQTRCLASHFPWGTHTLTTRERQFLVSGWGKWATCWWPDAAAPLLGAGLSWAAALQAYLLTPPQSAAPEVSVRPPKPPSAA
jgi:hypothetical protein